MRLNPRLRTFRHRQGSLVQVAILGADSEGPNGSRLDETYFFVISMDSTSTHIKESNQATILIWMIKCRKEVNLLLSLQGLRKISRSLRQQPIQSSILCLT